MWPRVELGGKGNMSGTERAGRRALVVAEAMDDIAEIDADGRENGGIDQAGVERIKQRLLRLAEHEDLFPDEDFPAPEIGSSSLMYRIAQDGDRLALYIQTVGEGVWAPPHEHTTWAVIVGMRGQELNRLYGPCAGEGEPRVQHEVVVERGTGVAMLGDGVHSIHVEGASANFHCYGLALEQLSGRRFWHAQHGEWREYNDIGTIVEARPGYVKR